MTTQIFQISSASKPELVVIGSTKTTDLTRFLYNVRNDAGRGKAHGPLAEVSLLKDAKIVKLGESDNPAEASARIAEFIADRPGSQPAKKPPARRAAVKRAAKPRATAAPAPAPAGEPVPEPVPEPAPRRDEVVELRAALDLMAAEMREWRAQSEARAAAQDEEIERLRALVPVAVAVNPADLRTRRCAACAKDVDRTHWARHLGTAAHIAAAGQ